MQAKQTLCLAGKTHPAVPGDKSHPSQCNATPRRNAIEVSSDRKDQNSPRSHSCVGLRYIVMDAICHLELLDGFCPQGTVFVWPASRHCDCAGMLKERPAGGAQVWIFRAVGGIQSAE